MQCLQLWSWPSSEVALLKGSSSVSHNCTLPVNHKWFSVQSDMQEASHATVEMKGMGGAVLEALVLAMYGDNSAVDLELLETLFMAADAHQVFCCAVLSNQQ